MAPVRADPEARGGGFGIEFDLFQPECSGRGDSLENPKAASSTPLPYVRQTGCTSGDYRLIAVFGIIRIIFTLFRI